MKLPGIFLFPGRIVCSCWLVRLSCMRKCFLLQTSHVFYQTLSAFAPTQHKVTDQAVQYTTATDAALMLREDEDLFVSGSLERRLPPVNTSCQRFS